MEFQCFQEDWLAFGWFIKDGKMFASGHIFGYGASIQIFTECVSNSAHIQTWQTIYAQEIPLTIIRFVEFRFRCAKSVVLSFLWTTES